MGVGNTTHTTAAPHPGPALAAAAQAGPGGAALERVINSAMDTMRQQLWTQVTQVLQGIAVDPNALIQQQLQQQQLQQQMAMTHQQAAGVGHPHVAAAQGGLGLGLGLGGGVAAHSSTEGLTGVTPGPQLTPIQVHGPAPGVHAGPAAVQPDVPQ
eukprot:GFYU01005677.1.p1 GENE.GFYU01005677.1~~GFYU01005677.1.p1  ORF type:complete len:163 (+),score=23.13 GFYU01005677.1:26-490(+)